MPNEAIETGTETQPVKPEPTELRHEALETVDAGAGGRQVPGSGPHDRSMHDVIVSSMHDVIVSS